MEFSDPIQVDQAINTHVQEVEVMYWHLEDAITANKKNRAYIMLDLLLYVAIYRPDLIKNGLKLIRVKYCI